MLLFTEKRTPRHQVSLDDFTSNSLEGLTSPISTPSSPTKEQQNDENGENCHLSESSELCSDSISITDELAKELNLGKTKIITDDPRTTVTSDIKRLSPDSLRVLEDDD